LDEFDFFVKVQESRFEVSDDKYWAQLGFVVGGSDLWVLSVKHPKLL
jgi:hypothetical protein